MWSTIVVKTSSILLYGIIYYLAGITCHLVLGELICPLKTLNGPHTKVLILGLSDRASDSSLIIRHMPHSQAPYQVDGVAAMATYLLCTMALAHNRFLLVNASCISPLAVQAFCINCGDMHRHTCVPA